MRSARDRACVLCPLPGAGVVKYGSLVVCLLAVLGCPAENPESPSLPVTSPSITMECKESLWDAAAGAFQVSISYSDTQGLDLNSLTVTLNGSDVKPRLSVGPSGASGTITGIPACPGIHIVASIKNSRGVSGLTSCNLDAFVIASPQTTATINNPLPVFLFYFDSRTDPGSFSVIFDGTNIASLCSSTPTSSTCTPGSVITPTGSHGVQATRCFSGGSSCCTVLSQFTFVPPIPRVFIRSPTKYTATTDVPVDLFYDDTSRVLGLGSTAATLTSFGDITPSLAYMVSSTVPGFPQSPTSFTATGIFNLTEGSSRLLNASAADRVYSQNGSTSLSFTVDVTNPSISISQPLDGTSSPPYFVSKDVSQPLSISYSDALSGIDLGSLMVSLTGSGTVSFNAGPSAAAGSLFLDIPTSSGSQGTGNFIVQARIKDMAGNQAQAGSSITLTLAHLGAGSKTVSSGSTFFIPINVYLDPSWPFGLGSYNIQISFVTSSISFLSVSGSDPASPVYAPEFSAAPANVGSTFPQLVSSNSLGSNATTPKGLINIANLQFQALSGSTTLSLSVIYFRDTSGASIPQSRIQDGFVQIN